MSSDNGNKRKAMSIIPKDAPLVLKQPIIIAIISGTASIKRLSGRYSVR